MPDLDKVIYSLERCTCHVPDACRDCGYDAGQPYNACVEALLKDALELLKEYVYGTRYVPVVRCYECQHWEPNNDEEGDHSGYCHKRFGACECEQTDATWFCSDGEKVEE